MVLKYRWSSLAIAFDPKGLLGFHSHSNPQAWVEQAQG
jgi:hypothetical protein